MIIMANIYWALIMCQDLCELFNPNNEVNIPILPDFTHKEAEA